MVGICCCAAPSSTILSRRKVLGFRCCSGAPINNKKETQTPQLLKVAVSRVTELLRLFSPNAKPRLDAMRYEQREEFPPSGIDDILKILKMDYGNAYFVTGIFTSAIYAEDCIFEDPTIRFRGKDLYSRNLKLLVPFFDNPSIVLQKIEKGTNSETNFVLASWKLRTYLKLPWRPLILIDGSTIYDLDGEFKAMD